MQLDLKPAVKEKKKKIYVNCFLFRLYSRVVVRTLHLRLRSCRLEPSLGNNLLLPAPSPPQSRGGELSVQSFRKKQQHLRPLGSGLTLTLAKVCSNLTKAEMT